MQKAYSSDTYHKRFKNQGYYQLRYSFNLNYKALPFLEDLCVAYNTHLINIYSFRVDSFLGDKTTICNCGTRMFNTVFTKSHLCLYSCNVDVILIKIKSQFHGFRLCDVYIKCRDSWLFDSEITAGTHADLIEGLSKEKGSVRKAKRRVEYCLKFRV
jgi:hypothetical protein